MITCCEVCNGKFTNNEKQEFELLIDAGKEPRYICDYCLSMEDKDDTIVDAWDQEGFK